MVPVGYLIHRLYTASVDEDETTRNDITEETVDSEPESDSNDELADDLPPRLLLDDDSIISQLLHLLRISLENNQDKNIVIALSELIGQSRFIKTQEEMLDAGIMDLLALSMKCPDRVVLLNSVVLLGNLSTSSRGLKMSRCFVPLLIENIMESMETDGVKDNPSLISLVKTASNISCEFDPKYERHYRDLCNFVVERQIDIDFFVEYVMKIVVNLSAQPPAREILLESGIISLTEDFISSVDVNSTRSDCILRCLYTVQNVLTCRVTNAALWTPSPTTIEKLNQFSTSLEASPSIVEKAMSINKIIYSKQ